MTVNRSETWSEALLVEPEHLKKLVDSLGSTYPQITFSAFCSDKNDRVFKSLPELIAYSNPSHAELKTLHIRGINTTTNKTFSIDLRESMEHNLRFVFEADEATWKDIKDAFEVFVDGSKPMYRFLSKRDWIFWIWAIFSGITLIAPRFFMWLSDQPSPPLFAKGMTVIDVVVIAIGISLLTGFTVLAVVFKKKFFPMLAFAIGNGVGRQKSLSIVRTVVIAAVAVSLVASALYNLLSQGRL